MIQLASTPVAHVTNTTPSVLDLFRGKDVSATLHRPIPAPEPNPEPNPGPDAAKRSASSGDSTISPADWDELFHAVQVRLEQCVGQAIDKSPELPLHDRHEVTKKAVLECVEAMQQLHAALTLERQLRQGQLQGQHQLLQQQAH